jgi:hypothetical protein
MRLPDVAFRALERIYVAQRRLRTAEVRRRIGARERALRAWADQALLAHEAGRCVPRCPFAHAPRFDTLQSRR